MRRDYVGELAIETVHKNGIARMIKEPAQAFIVAPELLFGLWSIGH